MGHGGTCVCVCVWEMCARLHVRALDVGPCDVAGVGRVLVCVCTCVYVCCRWCCTAVYAIDQHMCTNIPYSVPLSATLYCPVFA